MNSTDALLTGTIIDGKYRIEKILGQGGFGITYLATDVSLDRMVAIKEFFPKDYCKRHAGDSTVEPMVENFAEFAEQLRDKFVKEARHIAKLKHPGIVSIMAAFDQNGTSYYVMDVIDGASIETMVRERGPIPIDKAVSYVEQVGRALSFVHTKRVNHLDIKPSNIMVRSEDDKPILIDFGLAKHYDQAGRATTTTPTGMSHGYAPYEQYIVGGVSDFSPQTDVYSLAATLYYMLTGVVPPQAMTLIDGNLPFPDNMPMQVRKVLAKAMSVNKPMRHSSVSEFVADLKAAVSGDANRTQVAPPSQETVIVPPQPKTPKPGNLASAVGSAASTDGDKKRKNAIIIAAIVVVCALIPILIGLAGKGSKDPEPNPAVDTVKVGETSPQTVTDMEVTSPSGETFRYTGPVNDKGLPEGQGKGVYKDGVYEGSYKAGVREGKGSFQPKSGDEVLFEGTFANDKYERGKSTFSDGTWYEGTYRNDDAWDGSYYAKDGSVQGVVKNGKVQ